MAVVANQETPRPNITADDFVVEALSGFEHTTIYKAFLPHQIYSVSVKPDVVVA